MPSKADLTGYRGDMNLEEGGYFYRFTPGDDYADIVEVVPASAMGGPGNLFFISAGSLYMPANDDTLKRALECCGLASDESDPAQIIYALNAYRGFDLSESHVIQIGKRDPYHDYDHGGFGMPADDAITFLGAKTDLRGYVLANHVSWE